MKGRSLTLALVIMLVLILPLVLFTACGYTEYTVTFVIGDGRDNVTCKVATGGELYLPEPASDDEVFAGWFLDKELTKPYLSRRIEGDMTLYARFIKKGEFVVTYLYEDGVTPDTTLVMSGTLTEPVTPTRAGYAFSGWKDASTGLDYVFGSEPTSAHTVIKASWKMVTGGVSLTVYPGNGESYYTKNVSYNSMPAIPDTPERDGFIFLGWYADEECKHAFDFTKPLTKYASLYASWTIDTAALGNRVAKEALPAVVKIEARYSQYFGSEQLLSIGSGVIYKESINGRYYVLTNAHVVAGRSGYSVSYSITDAYGNEYTSVTLNKSSSTYDLAELCFVKGDTELGVADFASANPAAGSLLVSIGNPGGLTNSVTYGECLRYDDVTESDGNVPFVVGVHNTPIDHGSSGGPVFNSSLQLVGINYAAGSSEGEFVYGAFIQLALINEFLSGV